MARLIKQADDAKQMNLPLTYFEARELRDFLGGFTAMEEGAKAFLARKIHSLLPEGADDG